MHKRNTVQSKNCNTCKERFTEKIIEVRRNFLCYHIPKLTDFTKLFWSFDSVRFSAIFSEYAVACFNAKWRQS